MLSTVVAANWSHRSRGEHSTWRLVLAGVVRLRRRFGPRAGVERKKSALVSQSASRCDDRGRCFRAGEQAELSLKAEDVPGIDQRPHSTARCRSRDRRSIAAAWATVARLERQGAGREQALVSVASAPKGSPRRSFCRRAAAGKPMRA